MHRSTAIRKRSGAFVLLEVIISLTILAMTIAAILRSFTQSMSAVRHLEVETKAAIFAQQLLDEFETKQPAEGDTVGGFGDEYWQYSYALHVEYQDQDYENTDSHKEVETFIPLKIIKIEINYDDGVNKAFRAITINSAIMGFERFTPEARRQLLEF